MNTFHRIARPLAWATVALLSPLVSPGTREVSAQQANSPPYPSLGTVEVKDQRLRSLIPEGQSLAILATGFEWSEGPVWWREKGALLFSDIPRNTVFMWTEDGGIQTFLKPSGYTGSAAFTGQEPGSNGLVFSPDGDLILCQHGDRRVARLQEDGTFETLAAEYQGKRLNSPNDAVFKSDGSLYFTDPPYGLPGNVDDPAKELDYQGVYRLSPDGELTLLTKEMSRPNGIGFSPDEKTLYVANSDPDRAIWMAFPVKEDGTIGEGKVLADVTELVGKEPGLPDGMAVSQDGTIFATGPGGVLVFSPDGTHLGTLKTGEATANCTFGGEDGSTLFVTADMHLCRIPTKTRGLTAGK
ncbi:SMP-30/gluconolactonase/LRE family protein [Tautonia sociabilis]|uniref:SMP-30/gluconolactonase/LRE family protein n=1 Tax=Tautonia sociabilis TaxID=2080755 RepID=A0A432MJC1_9BACT|nr:SMP-30/gluconolactonase/LRE family protein [Tautonia sociabilis]RUL87389.1 SMP-30/gluconolactonase/LRE family protein [Tautonia sociabilis]